MYISRFVKTYQKIVGLDPKDTEIFRHMECHGYHDAMSWAKPDDHQRVCVLACKGL